MSNIFEQTPFEYLRGLAERLHHIAAVDGADVDRLRDIAASMDPDSDKKDELVEFSEALDNFLIETVKLSAEEYPDVFSKRHELFNALRRALDNVRWHAREAEGRRIKEKMEELIRRWRKSPTSSTTCRTRGTAKSARTG